MPPIGTSAFIVIAGHHPQEGKGQRLSQARGYITRKQHGGVVKKKRSKRNSPTICLIQVPANQGGTFLVKEPRPPIPVTSHPLLDPALFSAEKTRRIQKFFILHLCGRGHDHPFVHQMITWATNYPHFLSAKLLNASGWDDVLETGQLSPWTIRQRFVTVQLLQDMFSHEPNVSRHVTIAAIEALLAFELLNGYHERFNRLQKFCQTLINQCIQPQDDSWLFLARCSYLLAQANRLQSLAMTEQFRHPPPFPPPWDRVLYHDSRLHTGSHVVLPTPIEASLFTLGEQMPVPMTSEQSCIWGLMTDLHLILSIAATRHSCPLNQDSFDYFCSYYDRLLVKFSQHLSQFDMIPTHPQPRNSIIVDARIDSLELCILMLTSHILINQSQPPQQLSHTTHTPIAQPRPQLLSHAASHLRLIISSTQGSAGIGHHEYTTWTPYIGALMWCYAIGVRFAEKKQDKTWFLMQLLRVAHPFTFLSWGQLSRSLDLVVSCLERMG